MAHAVVNAALSLARGENALAGASSAVTAEAVGMISKAYYDKNPSELDESQKQTISALASLAAGLAGGLVGGDTATAVSGAQTGKVTVENNALSEAADYLATGKKPEDRYRDAQNQLKDAVNEFKAKNCAGLDAGACRVKMESHRDELLKGFGKETLDFVPIIGTIKTFAEAESALDYLYAAATLIPGERVASAILRNVEKALKKGDVAEASKLINKASDEIAGHLPAPGNISPPSSGIGSNAVFSVSNAQIGKKLGKHVEDFGGNPSNAADRQRVLDIINNIGSNPDKVIAGKFAGQGAAGGASRGYVFFRIKGNDVVVTKPDGSFVTVLKDGINNTSVKNALKGDPK